MQALTIWSSDPESDSTPGDMIGVNLVTHECTPATREDYFPSSAHDLVARFLPSYDFSLNPTFLSVLDYTVTSKAAQATQNLLSQVRDITPLLLTPLRHANVVILVVGRDKVYPKNMNVIGAIFKLVVRSSIGSQRCICHGLPPSAQRSVHSDARFLTCMLWCNEILPTGAIETLLTRAQEHAGCPSAARWAKLLAVRLPLTPPGHGCPTCGVLNAVVSTDPAQVGSRPRPLAEQRIEEAAGENGHQ
ncbi:hypothetical protein C8Q76DRAFT_726887 [Earliella scabrosa]|nr:hypothetical protein C8Q76DRAFT_726887 [Earliella scabrosa]